MTVFKLFLNNLDQYQVDQRHRIAYHTIGLSNSLYESCSQRQQVQDQGDDSSDDDTADDDNTDDNGGEGQRRRRRG